MKVEIDLPDNAYRIRVFYEYKGELGETIYAAKAIEDVKIKTVPAKVLEQMWRKDYAKKQKQEQKA